MTDRTTNRLTAEDYARIDGAVARYAAQGTGVIDSERFTTAERIAHHAVGRSARDLRTPSSTPSPSLCGDTSPDPRRDQALRGLIAGVKRAVTPWLGTHPPRTDLPRSTPCDVGH
jgi:hypothetical protein